MRKIYFLHLMLLLYVCNPISILAGEVENFACGFYNFTFERDVEDGNESRVLTFRRKAPIANDGNPPVVDAAKLSLKKGVFSLAVSLGSSTWEMTDKRRLDLPGLKHLKLVNVTSDFGHSLRSTCIKDYLGIIDNSSFGPLLVNGYLQFCIQQQTEAQDSPAIQFKETLQSLRENKCMPKVVYETIGKYMPLFLKEKDPDYHPPLGATRPYQLTIRDMVGAEKSTYKKQKDPSLFADAFNSEEEHDEEEASSFDPQAIKEAFEEAREYLS